MFVENFDAVAFDAVGRLTTIFPPGPALERGERVVDTGYEVSRPDDRIVRALADRIAHLVTHVAAFTALHERIPGFGLCLFDAIPVRILRVEAHDGRNVCRVTGFELAGLEQHPRGPVADPGRRECESGNQAEERSEDGSPFRVGKHGGSLAGDVWRGNTAADRERTN